MTIKNKKVRLKSTKKTLRQNQFLEFSSKYIHKFTILLNKVIIPTLTLFHVIILNQMIKAHLNKASVTAIAYNINFIVLNWQVTYLM